MRYSVIPFLLQTTKNIERMYCVRFNMLGLLSEAPCMPNTCRVVVMLLHVAQLLLTMFRLRRVRISGAVYVRGFAQDVWPWCSALLQIIVQYIRLCCKFRFSLEITCI